MREDKIVDRIKNQYSHNNSLFNCIEQWLETKIRQVCDTNFPIGWTLHNNGYDDYENDRYITVSFHPKDGNQRILDVDCGQPSSKSWSEHSSMLTFETVSGLIPSLDDPYRKNLEKLAVELGFTESIVGILNTLSNG